MACCRHCEDASDLFSPRAARRDLRRFRARGPSATTRLLLDALLSQRADDHTVLDIGGGVGAIPQELLGAGFSSAVQVDASPAYLAAAEEEARRRGTGERVAFRYGDFVDLAPDIEEAEVVTLDRVICCYPDVERLVTASERKARHLYGLVFPRERLLTAAGVAFGNGWFRLRGSAFRSYLHPARAVDGLLRAAGFRRTSLAYSLLWQVATYAREPSPVAIAAAGAATERDDVTVAHAGSSIL